MKSSKIKTTFYLGVEEGDGKPLLYESKHLTTHAVCIGMTGSGKTGLGINLIEEAVLDGIPAIVIDPKGDMVNLLLPPTGNDDRIEDYKSVEKVVYTPGSELGRPLSILASFDSGEKEGMRERVLTTTSGLLGLVGLKGDPIQSREHILISNLLQQAWEQGESLDLTTLIDQVQNPPFETIGALDIETFYPAKERKSLVISLNNLLASPGFSVWMEGDSLDIEKLFGKPQITVFYIAHLSDPERMFFVTLLLNEIIGWMRRQKGSSDLRALLYMDEIFGFFPPSAMPPSKLPMLTLLKQARAFGLGVVVATQNPVDLDYKGLSNCGTWFIGKLQTERDKARLMEGLEAPVLNKLLSEVGKRVFILRSIYEKKPVLFKTRDTLSDLQGPLTLEQIGEMTPKKKKQMKSASREGLFVRTSEKNPLYKPYALVETKKLTILAPINAEGIDWEKGEDNPKLIYDRTPQPNSSFAPLPDFNLALSFKEYFCKSDPKRLQLVERVKKAEEKLSDSKAKAKWRLFDTFVSLGSTIVGIFMGKKKLSKGNIDKAGVTFRRAGRVTKDNDGITLAEENLQSCKKQLEEYDAKENPLEIEKTAVVWKA